MHRFLLFICTMFLYYQEKKAHHNNWMSLRSQMTTTKIFSFGVFTLFPTWPLPNTSIYSFTAQRARLTPCPLRKCNHPEGNFQRLLFTYLQSREQGWHLAHIGSINHQKEISEQKQFTDFFTVHKAILRPGQIKKCNHPDVSSIFPFGKCTYFPLVMHRFFAVYMYTVPILSREEITSH